MNIPNIRQFEEIADQCDGVEFYGEYQGRFFYEGIAVAADDAAAAANFMMELVNAGYAMPAWDHQDQLGLGIIVAWEHENFIMEEVA